MRNWFVCIAVAVAMLVCAGGAQAQTLLYSFEVIAPGGGPPGPDGFFGLGAAVTQEPTIGVTHLENSMKYDIVAGQGFVGARTEIVDAVNLNNPPGVSHVLFDLFLPTAYGGTFADIGVTVFGHDVDNGNFGLQQQFTDVVSIAALAPGQHLDLRIDLDSEFFTGQSFDNIFGDDVSDLDVASAFQFYISKNGGAQGTPLTVYIDNVRLVVPEPATFGLAALGCLGVAMIRRRSRG